MLGCSLWSCDAAAQVEGKRETEFRGRWHVRENRIALGPHYGKDAEIAALDLCDQRGRHLHNSLDASAEEIDHGLSVAKRHIDGLCATDPQPHRPRAGP